MDRPHPRDGGIPFVLLPPQIAELNRRASLCDHAVTAMVLVATMIPLSTEALSCLRARRFDAQQGTIRVVSPSGARVVVALGGTASKEMAGIVAGRRRGPVFDDGHGGSIVADHDAAAYADELMDEAAGSPLPFEWSFRSLREGVFAGMADDVVPQHVATAHAGLGHPGSGDFAELLLRIQQRAASDWWAATLGVPGPETIEVLRACAERLRWNESDLLARREGWSS